MKLRITHNCQTRKISTPFYVEEENLSPDLQITDDEHVDLREDLCHECRRITRESGYEINGMTIVWFKPDGNKFEPDWDKVLAFPHAKLHLYGKLDARKGRKMGHITCVGSTPEEAMKCALQVCDAIGLPKPEHI